MKYSVAFLLSLVASSQAFAPMPQASRQMTKINLLSQSDMDSVITQVNDCAEGECSVDEVDDLIAVLKKQQKELYDRVEQIRGMVSSLENINTTDERKVDEIRETVRAIYRVFQLGAKASGNDYPALSKPTGYSGEVGKGPTTAYDALPPKKYKASP